jgi:hypothetical protein
MGGRGPKRDGPIPVQHHRTGIASRVGLIDEETEYVGRLAQLVWSNGQGVRGG